MNVRAGFSELGTGSLLYTADDSVANTRTYSLRVLYDGRAMFYSPNNNVETSITRDKWIFVVFYFDRTAHTWTIISPDLSPSVVINDLNYPGNHIKIGQNTNAFFYEVQAFIKVQQPTKYEVTLYDNANEAYIATTSACLDSCSPYCYRGLGCLNTTTTWCPCPNLCNCASLTDGVCTSCKDNSFKSGNKCKCNAGYNQKGSSCNFYIGLPPNCVAGSGALCTQCESNYFLYDNITSSTTICLSCDSCKTCNASPNCFECAEIVVKDGNGCRVDSIGYQISFIKPNLIIDFAHPLSSKLRILKFKAKTDSNEDISTSSWTLSPLSTLSQYQIVTDLTESQFPVNADFSFETVEG